MHRIKCRFRGVVVITSALHAEGPRFEPGRNQIFLSPVKAILKIASDRYFEQAVSLHHFI